MGYRKRLPHGPPTAPGSVVASPGAGAEQARAVLGSRARLPGVVMLAGAARPHRSTESRRRLRKLVRDLFGVTDEFHDDLHATGPVEQVDDAGHERVCLVAGDDEVTFVHLVWVGGIVEEGRQVSVLVSALDVAGDVEFDGPFSRSGSSARPRTCWPAAAG